MISAHMKYGGVSAKVRALYGKHLKRADFEKLIAMDRVRDIAAYLQEAPGWRDALRGLDLTDVHRHDLEQALRNELYLEYIRIYQFMSAEDHPLMRYLIRRREHDEVLNFLRTLISGNPSEYRPMLPHFFREKSRLPFDRFADCKTFSEFLNLLSGTVYGNLLSAAPRTGEAPPDYALVKTILLSHYLNEMAAVVKKQYRGETAQLLEQFLFVRAELLNINTIMRIKRYFPEMTSSSASFLLPFHYYLRVPFLSALLDAPSAEAAMDMLKQSPYAKLYGGPEFHYIEDYQNKYLFEVNRKLLSTTVPSVYTPIAYLTLKEFEVSNLIHILECTYYGVKPSDHSILLLA